jgi:hypothetical protein
MTFRVAQNHGPGAPGLVGGRSDPVDSEAAQARQLPIHIGDGEVENDLPLAQAGIAVAPGKSAEAASGKPILRAGISM